LICLLCGIILLIVCLWTTAWLRSGAFSTGLFRECVATQGGSTVPGAPSPGTCQPARGRAYVKAVAALLIAAAILTFIAALLNIFGLRSSDLHHKHLAYKLATYIALVAVLCELVSLVVFPASFYTEMSNFGQREWEFDWSYGVAWGATLFTFGASLLLICDKEHEEIYYKEKTIYTPPVGLK